MTMVLMTAIALATALPTVALAQTVTEAELIQLAVDRGTCGDDKVPVAAAYVDANTVSVTCSDDATGFVPAVAGLGGAAAAGLVLVAAGGGARSSTTSRGGA